MPFWQEGSSVGGTLGWRDALLAGRSVTGMNARRSAPRSYVKGRKRA